MSDLRTAHPEATRRGLAAAWRRNGLVWLALIGLQAASVALAYARLPGSWAFPVEVAIAGVQAVLVATVSMDLARSPTLNRLAAAAGFVFVLVLFALTLSDLFTR